MLTGFSALSFVPAVTLTVALMLPVAAASAQSAVAQTQAAGITRTDHGPNFVGALFGSFTSRW